MGHSTSSLNSYSDCQYRYKLSYIDHVNIEKDNDHLRFGTMAHDVLYKAGILRDEAKDGVISKNEYSTIIPSEVLYEDLKEKFKIDTWQLYFTRAIKQIAQYEDDLIADILTESDSKDLSIHREFKLQKKYDFLDEPIVGVIDLLLITKTHAYIIDYKFSNTRKTQFDFDMNSQLPLYAKLVSEEYNINPRNIKYGYIDIPKQDFSKPQLLSNGTLSRAKTQNVSSELYRLWVETVHGKDDPKYNCNPGGYYEEAYYSFMLNKPAYLTIQWLDSEIFNNVNAALMETALEIDDKIKRHKPFLRKFDSHSCERCEYLNLCKPYLKGSVL